MSNVLGLFASAALVVVIIFFFSYILIFVLGVFILSLLYWACGGIVTVTYRPSGVKHQYRWLTRVS